MSLKDSCPGGADTSCMKSKLSLMHGGQHRCHDLYLQSWCTAVHQQLHAFLCCQAIGAVAEKRVMMANSIISKYTRIRKPESRGKLAMQSLPMHMQRIYIYI